MAVDLMRFKTPPVGLKATNMIVLVHKLTQRVLTSSLSVRYVWKCVHVCVCVRQSAFSSIHLSCLSENGRHLKF